VAVVISLTTLGCSGSYGAPAGGACSGYLVRAGGATIWMDCGNGTLAALQREANVADLDAVVITHTHPDHCVDIYGLHVLNKYGLERLGLPVYAPVNAEHELAHLVRGDWGGAFAWHPIEDGGTATVRDATLRFSETDHPVTTLAVEVSAADKRLIYTSDTGPKWSPEVFGPGADLLLSEASYLHDDIKVPIHLSARQAGEYGRETAARRLVLTHLWPMVDPVASAAEGSEAFGAPVTLAAPGATLHL
jgi:ribonuclease BN (tRNA processing enzyme)